MFNLLGKRKGIATEILSRTEMDQDLRPSLFFSGNLRFKAAEDGGLPVLQAGWGHGLEVGFGTSWSSSVSGYPAREEALTKNLYMDRFLNVTVGKKQKVLAQIEIKEQPVYDQQYRCPIDFTGVAVNITLHEDAYAPFVEYVALPDPDDPGNRLFKEYGYGYAVGFALRLPCEPFLFLEQRGGKAPYSPAGKFVTEANVAVMKKFDVDDFVVAKFGVLGRGAKAEPSAPFGERYGVESGLRVSLA